MCRWLHALAFRADRLESGPVNRRVAADSDLAARKKDRELNNCDRATGGGFAGAIGVATVGTVAGCGVGGHGELYWLAKRARSLRVVGCKLLASLDWQASYLIEVSRPAG